jgi:hypothetical protein
VKHVHTIPGKLEVHWDPDTRSIVDIWTSYYVTVEEFKTAILDAGLGFARQNGGRAWIVDSSAATSNFSPEIQACIASEVFPAFARAGIKTFVTIAPASALTRLSVKTYTSKVGSNGIQLVEASDLAEARELLKKSS